VRKTGCDSGSGPVASLGEFSLEISGNICMILILIPITKGFPLTSTTDFTIHGSEKFNGKIFGYPAVSYEIKHVNLTEEAGGTWDPKWGLCEIGFKNTKRISLSSPSY
jgi:hypothetical protein